MENNTLEEYLKENYSPKSEKIYIDSDYTMTDSNIRKIIEAENIEEINQIIDDEFDNIYFYSSQHIKEEILDNVSSALELDKEYIRDDVEQYIVDAGVIKLDINDLMKGTIRANITPINTDLGSEDFDFNNTGDLIPLNDNFDTDEVCSANLKKAMEILKVNPYEIGEILLERNDIESNSFPKIEYEDCIKGEDFFEELENSSYGGTLMFTTNISVSDYINNYDLYQERGVTIPKNTSFGFIDHVNGSCGFVGLKTKDDINLVEYQLSHDPDMIGYGLDSIADVSPSCYWDASELNFIKTDNEKEAIRLADIAISELNLSMKQEKSNKPLSLVGDYLKGIQSNIDEGNIKDDAYLNSDKFIEKVSKYYWIKDDKEILNKALPLIENLENHIKAGVSPEFIVSSFKYSDEDFISPIQAVIKFTNERIKMLKDRDIKSMLANLIKNGTCKEGTIRDLAFYKTSDGACEALGTKPDIRFSNEEKEAYDTFVKNQFSLVDNSVAALDSYYASENKSEDDVEKIASVIDNIVANHDDEPLLAKMLGKKGYEPCQVETLGSDIEVVELHNEKLDASSTSELKMK